MEFMQKDLESLNEIFEIIWGIEFDQWCIETDVKNLFARISGLN